MVVGVESATEFNINHGPIENRPTDPLAGSVYISPKPDEPTTALIMSVCAVDGVWQEQIIPIDSPLSIGNADLVLFNDAPLYTPRGSATLYNFVNSNPHPLSGDSIDIRVTNAGANLSILVSTSPTVAGLTDQNILSAGSYFNGNLTVFKKTAYFPTGSQIYAYRGPISDTYDELLTNLSTNPSSFAPPASTGTLVQISYMSVNFVKVVTI
jgi:hypothetical protein